MNEPIFVVQQKDEKDEWCIESIHRSETTANIKLKKISREEDYSEKEEELYLNIEEHTLID